MTNNNDQSVEDIWKEFWEQILIKEDGSLDLEQVKKELADFHDLIHNASEVYDHVTGGTLSKPNSAPVYVIQFAEDRIKEQLDEQEKEMQEVYDADVKYLESEIKRLESELGRYQDQFGYLG